MVTEGFVTGVPFAALAFGLFGCVLLLGVLGAVRLTGKR